MICEVCGKEVPTIVHVDKVDKCIKCSSKTVSGKSEEKDGKN